jgi:hypothetical protein
MTFFSRRTISAAFVFSAMLGASTMRAQDLAPAADVTLPDAPQPALVASTMAMDAPGSNNTAPRYALRIAQDETAQPMHARDKVVAGLRDTYSLTSLGGIFLSAGYGQITNGPPNYGTDRGAFGQRLGAAAIRSTSDDVFAISILSPVFHDDPRYYVRGSQSSFGGRVVYAVTRVFITRTDSGHSTLNAPVLIGYAGTAAMTPLYYPKFYRNYDDVASAYGTSLGGAALGNLVSEFSGPLLHALHMGR